MENRAIAALRAHPIAPSLVTVSISPHVALPATARAPLHVGDGSTGAWIEVLADVPRDVQATHAAGATTFLDAAPGIDVVLLPTSGGVEEVRILRRFGAATLARYAIVAGSAIAAMRVREGRVEAIDARGRVAVAAAPPFAVDARGTRREVSVALDRHDDGYLLELRLDDRGLEYPIAVDPSWTTKAPMSVARTSFTLTTLGGTPERALAVGGISGAARLSSCELYDVAENTWSSTASLPGTVYGHRVVRLPSGVVLLHGGFREGGTFGPAQFDATTRAWTVGATTAFDDEHRFAPPVALASGKVFFSGGAYSGNTAASLYDPSAGTWTATTPASIPRTDHAAVLLSSGRVLVCGGNAGISKASLSSCELYDPSTASWKAAAPLSSPRSLFNMVAVPGGALLAGGARYASGAPVDNYSTTEVYDAATDTWKSATLPTLPARTILVTTSTAAHTLAGSTSQAWSFATRAWIAATGLAAFHLEGAATVLSGDRVLVAGGDNNVSEILAPVAAGSSCASSAECASGFCADGICCNRACTGPCEACSTGTCTGLDGAPKTGRTCGAYLCRAGACNTSCTSDTACATGFGCLAGVCVARATLGATCKAPTDCGSGFCADGVCCDTACTGQCEACDGGKCHLVKDAPVGGRPACTGTGSGTDCGARCDGMSTACAYPTWGCASPGCTAGIATAFSVCTQGVCPATSTKSCDAYTCDGSECRTSCTSDAHCAPGHWCKPGTPTATCVAVSGLGKSCASNAECSAPLACVDGACCGSAACDAGSTCNAPAGPGTCRKNDGGACSIDAQCAKGHCVDGVCCDRACDVQCEACDTSGMLGTCRPVAGAPHGARPACARESGDPAATSCGVRTCDGARDTTSCVGFAAGPNVMCKAPSCHESSFTAASTCDGAGGCRAPTPTSCVPYACVEGGCLPSCGNDANCASGYRCKSGACVGAAHCSEDRATAIDLEGAPRACAPYACGAAGECLSTCGSSADCAAQFVCDVSSKICVAGGEPGPTSAGCTTSRTSSGCVGAFFAVAWLALRRRRTSTWRSV